MAVTSTAPSIDRDDSDLEGRDGARLRLRGRWTLQYANDVGALLRDAPQQPQRVDATQVERLDSTGVLQLLRFAHRHGLDFATFEFRADHHALVAAIEDVADDRPKKKREYGFAAALGRLGFAVADNWAETVALISFMGENLAKLLRMVKEPRRFRLTATVFHMEQVGLDAVPLVFLLSYLVGAVIAFLGANVLQDFGATIYVVELVNVAFLREFGVLLTAILLAGRTASAFTAQIGAMVSRRNAHARSGPGRCAGDPAATGTPGHAAAAELHRRRRRPARRHVGGCVRPQHPTAGLPGANAGNDAAAAFPGGAGEGADFCNGDRADWLPRRVAGARHCAIGRRAHHLQRGAGDLAGHHP